MNWNEPTGVCYKNSGNVLVTVGTPTKQKGQIYEFDSKTKRLMAIHNVTSGSYTLTSFPFVSQYDCNRMCGRYSECDRFERHEYLASLTFQE